MTEHLLAPVLELARITGWHVMHARPARTERGRGWATALSGHAGYPDITLAKIDQSPVFLELKGPGKYPTDAQLSWLRALAPHAALVRPEDWSWIEWRVGLRGRDRPADPSLKYSYAHNDGEWTGALADWATKRAALVEPAACTGKVRAPRVRPARPTTTETN